MLKKINMYALLVKTSVDPLSENYLMLSTLNNQLSLGLLRTIVSLNERQYLNFWGDNKPMILCQQDLFTISREEDDMCCASNGWERCLSVVWTAISWNVQTTDAYFSRRKNYRNSLLAQSAAKQGWDACDDSQTWHIFNIWLSGSIYCQESVNKIVDTEFSLQFRQQLILSISWVWMPSSCFFTTTPTQHFGFVMRGIRLCSLNIVFSLWTFHHVSA